MDQNSTETVESVGSTINHSQRLPNPDWVAFWSTALAALAVYLFTLAPQVTLQTSGIFAVSANYGGVADSPGFPLWTIYAWCFTKAVPFSSVAFVLLRQVCVTAFRPPR